MNDLFITVSQKQKQSRESPPSFAALKQQNGFSKSSHCHYTNITPFPFHQ